VTNQTTAYGVQLVWHPIYDADPPGGETRLLQGATVEPGRLWVGDDCCLDRAEVAELVAYLSHWLSTGKLFTPDATEGGK
jgi:hypothetical protein